MPRMNAALHMHYNSRAVLQSLLSILTASTLVFITAARMKILGDHERDRFVKKRVELLKRQENDARRRWLPSSLFSSGYTRRTS
jgi:hypothetical protein